MTKIESMNWIINDAKPQTDGKSWIAGAQASLSRKTTAPTAWESIQLKVSYTTTGAGFYINLDPWYIAIEEAQGRVTLSKYLGGNLMAASEFHSEPESWNTVEVSADLLAINVVLNGESVLESRSSASTPMTSARLYFAGGAQFTEPEMTVSEIASHGALPPSGGITQKALDVTVDFYDDMLLTPFNQEMLDEMFRVMARMGTSQAYWIHHGGRGSGLWESGPGRENMARSFDLLGDDYLPAAVSAAHKANLPLIGIFKPYDTAILHYTSPLSANSNAASALGGWLDMGFTFPAAHPELCLQRRSVPTSENRPRQITIRSRHELPADCAGQIELFVSSDNETYNAYRGALKVEVAHNEIKLSGFEIEEKFLAFSFSPGLASQIQNTLPVLVQVCDAAGDILDFTYGTTSRLRRTTENHLAGSALHLDFRQHGINFDCAGHGVPSAVWNSRKTLLDLYSPANSHNVMGLAFGVNPHVAGMLSEAEPGAHKWWLSVIEEMLDAGVDGVEIRIMNHSNVIDWEQYGFNAPLVEEYRRRYGVDITREEFSREKFRELRGEFFTDFLRTASRLVRGRGKKFRMHIEDTHQGLADEPCPMEIAMPWRQWIDEGLCDGVTLKVLNSWGNDTAFGREVIAMCRARDIPVSFSSFIHSAFMSAERQELLDSYLASAYDSFNVYEFATLFEFTPEGEVTTVHPAMNEWLDHYQWRQAALEEAAH